MTQNHWPKDWMLEQVFSIWPDFSVFEPCKAFLNSSSLAQSVHWQRQSLPSQRCQQLLVCPRFQPNANIQWMNDFSQLTLLWWRWLWLQLHTLFLGESGDGTIATGPGIYVSAHVSWPWRIMTTGRTVSPTVTATAIRPQALIATAMKAIATRATAMKATSTQSAMQSIATAIATRATAMITKATATATVGAVRAGSMVMDIHTGKSLSGCLGNVDFDGWAQLDETLWLAEKNWPRDSENTVAHKKDLIPSGCQTEFWCCL